MANKKIDYRKIMIIIIFILVFFVIFRNKKESILPEREVAISQQSASTSAAVPEGWQTYTNDTLDFSISHPDNYEVTPNGDNSIMVVKKVATPGQGPSNFIYISVVGEDDQNTEGEIYNFNKTQFDTLVSMNINEEKPLAGESADLAQYITYKRLPDTTIAGQKAQAYVNQKPWEFPMGTKEYRYIVNQPKKTYLIGAYISTTSHNDYTIAEDEYSQILTTIRLSPLPSEQVTNGSNTN